MKVLIIENNQDDICELFSLLDNFEEESNIKIDKHVEHNYTYAIENANHYDMVFFDIELDEGVNGIDLACQVRKNNRDIRIMFVSNFSKYLADGYKAKAEAYLLKPIIQDEFNNQMKEIVADYIYNDMGIMDEKLSQTKIYFHNILYVEMLQRKINLHMVNGDELSCFDTLIRWKELLKDCPFSQPHRSFLVNIEHIKKYQKNEIIMEDNTVIPVTLNYKNEFRLDYLQYINRRVL